ncbi:MAG: lipid-A-disaccharide synthase N-terminal domain-containing protein [Acidobacteria bacterium]|nr:lipid-A-disaccharide synthase N-terminal domain-containing protein [Acidobacteriota bacterium]MDW7985474.1 lipid-A-disaccharide synthase N-terminal domain-containing protein [Acidobacteriota bacterium]
MTDFWLILGLVGQGLFSARFLIQWIASERARRSVVPTLFWVFSILGSTILLIYAIHRRDPVFVLGQSLGLFVYGRNLYLIWREKGTLPLSL